MLLMLSDKGKYASATENRRFVWAEIVWPLILEIGDVAFTLKQYQKKRDEVCAKKNVNITVTSRGLLRKAIPWNDWLFLVLSTR